MTNSVGTIAMTTNPPLRRARIVVGIALFGAVVAGALFGHTNHIELYQLAGALMAVVVAHIANII